MNKTLDITYSVTGQSLFWDPPEGVPSSVTSVAVYPITTGDDGTAELATTGSASIDSVSTTFDAASGDGQAEPRKLNLASTSNIAVGVPYLCTSATTGETEFVTVARIASNDYVYTLEPMRRAWASSDTFKGTRISISVDSTWVADSSNISDNTDPSPRYRVRWCYVVSSVTYVHDGYFDLVRYPGTHSVTPNDMLSVVPNWLDRLPTYHRDDHGERLIDQAYENVKWDMYRAGHADEMIRHSGAMDRLVQLQAWVLLERIGESEVQQALSLDAYNAEMDGLVRVVTKIPEATDTSGAGYNTAARSIWGK
jgi:hypothetical protein